jgi:predicted secreted protein
MAFRHGKNASFKIDNSGGTLTDISTYLDDVSLPRSIETAETTTFGVSGGAKTYVTGLNDSTISIGGKWHATLDGVLAGILGQDATVSFEYGPEGTTVSRVKYTGEAIVTSYEVGSPVGDVVTFSAELQVTGPVTRGTF